MKIKSFYLLLLFPLLIFSCKKNGNTTSSTTPNPPDSSQTVLLGLDTITASDLDGITAVEDLDISKLLQFKTQKPTSSSWHINVPPPMKQRYNDCVGWALGYGLIGYYYNTVDGNTNYSPLDSNFSPLYIYNQLNKKKDKGIKITDALNLTKEQGCSRWFYMPEDKLSYLSDVPTAARENAANYTISEWHNFKTIDIPLIKKIISLNYPILFGCKTYKSLYYNESCKSCRYEGGDSIHVYTKSEGSFMGNHALLICGYNDDLNAFEVLNSWGRDHGDLGYYWIDYNYFSEIVNKHFFGDEIFLALPRKVITYKASDIQLTSSVINCKIIADYGFPTTNRGICYSISKNPTINDNKIESGSGLGKYAVTLTGLLPNQIYYARAFAQNSSGINYGNEVNFTTLKAGLPLLTTTDATLITTNTATSGGNISDDGGAPVTGRGVCWSKSASPTINDSKTSDGTGTGTFTSSITGLSSNITYYVRAYATNSSGTAYGNDVSFTTSGSSSSDSSGIPSQDPNCKENNTGDYCFQNNTGLELELTLMSSPSKEFSYTPPFICTIQPGQQQCFFGVPAGPANYEIKTPATYTGYGSDTSSDSYFAEGSLYVDQCKANIFVIK